MNQQEHIDYLARVLEMHFSHADYLRLTRAGKLAVCADVAKQFIAPFFFDAELGALLRKLPANVDLCHQESGKWVVFDLRQPLPNGIGKCADTPDEALRLALDAEAVPPAVDAEQPRMEVGK